MKKEQTMVVIYKTVKTENGTQTTTEVIGDDLMGKFKRSVAEEILREYIRNK